MEFNSSVEVLGVDEFLSGGSLVDPGRGDFDDGNSGIEVYESYFDWLKPGGRGDVFEGTGRKGAAKAVSFSMRRRMWQRKYLR